MYLLPGAPIELAPRAIWIVILLVFFYALVIAVFVRHIGIVVKAVLEERDPRLKEILREVLQDLLELFRHGRHR